MAKKKKNVEVLNGNVEASSGDLVIKPDDILSSAQEVADELKMSLRQFYRLIDKYPFDHSGVAGKILGRWKVTRADVHRWFHYVQRQERRHPDARRMRPEEPPDLAQIKGR